MTYIKIVHHKALVVTALLLAFVAPSSLAAAKPVQWLPNMTAALAYAKKQNKPILAYFSSSDWDEWGKKLDKEVLKSDNFAEWANKNVILFQADFAVNKKQDLYKKQNEELKTKYQVAVVPTFLLLDSDGEVIARAVYENLKLLPNEVVGQPKSAIEFLDNMVKNRGESEPLVTYGGLQQTVDNAKAHKLPVLLLVTKGEKDPMLLEAEKLLHNQKFIRWVNINTSFHTMKWPAASDKSVDAALFSGLSTQFKFGNTPAQLLMFMPGEENLRMRSSSWAVMQMEPLMMNLQKNLPVIEYKGTDWLTDIRTARAIVAQQPKRILFMYFADGTEYCQKFEKEILETEEFTGWPFYHLVLVKLDFAKGVERPKLLDQQNEELANLYGVRGYPFVVLVNNKGQKVGEAKYQRGGPKSFVEELKRVYNADVDRRILTPADVEIPVKPE
ncbi:MAG: trxA [Phycisphaerales bacterium]|nr:trxA [Phycisphaerales bacterium]